MLRIFSANQISFKILHTVRVFISWVLYFERKQNTECHCKLCLAIVSTELLPWIVYVSHCRNSIILSCEGNNTATDRLLKVDPPPVSFSIYCRGYESLISR
jgi:hypothetical protein